MRATKPRPKHSSLLEVMGWPFARSAVGVVIGLLLALPVGPIHVGDAGATYRSGADLLVPAGELHVSQTNESLDAVAVSGGTAVAVNAIPGVAYAFDEPSSGWSTESQVAKLVAPDPLSRAVAIDGSTIVVGAPDSTVGSNLQEGAVYVFEEPPGGWVGTISPAAKLIPSDGVADERFGSSLGISGSTVVVGANKPGSGSGGYAFGGGVVYVFAEPAGGWTGTFGEVAQLVPSGGGLLWQQPSVAISGQTVVADGHVGSRGVDYLFQEPSAGWSGTVPQKGQLLASAGYPIGPVQIAGGSIFATGSSTSGCTCTANLIYVFRSPEPGWAGTERESASLTFNSPPPEGLWMAASAQTATVATLSGCSRYESACGGSIWTFTEPSDGWSGEILATPAASISSSVGGGLALSGNTLFFSHGTDNSPGQGGVSMYQVSGSSQFAPPTVSPVSLNGLDRGVPRLQLKLTSSPNAPDLKSITLSVPAGLSFAPNRHELARGISINGMHRFSLGRAGNAIAITLSAATQSAIVTAARPALREAPSLLKRVDALTAYNRIMRHGNKKHLRLTLLLSTIDTQNFHVQLHVTLDVT
jgi:hypothetical protein